MERQLPWNTTLAVTYTNRTGCTCSVRRNQRAAAGNLQSERAGQRRVSARPSGPVYLMERPACTTRISSLPMSTARLNAGFSLFGFYVLNRAMSNTDGVGTFPANPYNFEGEYGPAATDVRHRLTVGGSINFKWNVRISPFVVVQTGCPSTSPRETIFTARRYSMPGPASPRIPTKPE